MELWSRMPQGCEIMPEIEYYKAELKFTDAVFVIFPGGGYSRLAQHEGAGYAKLFNVWGADAFVVKYSVAPVRFPAQLNDARRAVQYVRANADKYGVNPKKVIVVGSSAGGHLASMLSTYNGATEYLQNDEICKVDFIPDYQVLCYPVVNLSDDDIAHLGSRTFLLGKDYDKDLAMKLSSDLACDKNTPPAFIWHNQDDSTVNILNSINYAKSLVNCGVPVELHIFPYGQHGVGVATNKHSGQWKELLLNWLKEMKVY